MIVKADSHGLPGAGSVSLSACSIAGSIGVCFLVTLRSLRVTALTLLGKGSVDVLWLNCIRIGRVLPLSPCLHEGELTQRICSLH
ncbi:hypothetical protein R1flu_015541 [Riccia fluitans]|uniref:Uncharacterized protein n=1 Tax=Riccia fluitans TaxID=41844 RepID=A0ABD1YJN1_9MARC